jgi:hypothetical protein
MRLPHGCPMQSCWWVIVPALLACGSRPDDERSTAAVASATLEEPADSLISTTPKGVEIWFTIAREARGAGGKQCVERGLEIRHGETRVKVPLLYTGATPMLINDSTMRAVLWTHCEPGDSYLVDLRSGRPVRERGERGS